VVSRKIYQKAKKEINDMTNKETIERNIGLTFDFVNHLIDNKADLEKLPDNFIVEFVEKDFPKLQRKHTTNKAVHNTRKFVQVKNFFVSV
jgi:hypothetical protein